MAELVSPKDVVLKQLNRSRAETKKDVLGTPSENTTPRTLIQGLLDTASINKSALHVPQSKKPILIKSPQVPLPQKRRRSLRKSLSENATPRTLIRNYLNEASPETPLEIPQQVQFIEKEKGWSQNASQSQETKNVDKLPASVPADKSLPNQYISLVHKSILDSQTNLAPSLIGSSDKNDVVCEELNELLYETQIKQKPEDQNEPPQPPENTPGSQLNTESTNNKRDCYIGDEHTETLFSQNQEPTEHLSRQDISQEIMPDSQSLSESTHDGSTKGEATESSLQNQDPTDLNLSRQDISQEIMPDSQSLSESTNDGSTKGEETESSLQNQDPTDLNLSRQDISQEIIPDSQSLSESENDERKGLTHDNMANEISENVAMVTDTLMTEETRSTKWKNLVTPGFPVTKRKVLHEMTSDLDENTTERKKVKYSSDKRKQPSRTSRVSSRKTSSDANLPTSLVKSIFQHFSKRKVTKETLEVIQRGSRLFFKNMSTDLMAYCKHAGRTTIEIGDVELLMKRQGFITTKQSLYSLVEKYLPMEYRQELIPVAQSGNKILVKRS